MTSAEKPDLAAVRAALVDRLRLLREATAATKGDRAPVVLDQSSVGRLSRIDAIQMQEMALATEQRREAEMRRTEAAIRRLDNGDYGFCVVCDEPIAPKRLAVDPAVPTCIRCAEGKSSQAR